MASDGDQTRARGAEFTTKPLFMVTRRHQQWQQPQKMVLRQWQQLQKMVSPRGQ